MSATLVIGAVMALVGLVLLGDVGGLGDLVIKAVTSRNLGSLPPGYAASRTGFRVYSALIVAIGVVFAGFGVAETSVPLGSALFGLGAIAFVVLSVLAIRGELLTYRALKR